MNSPHPTPQKLHSYALGQLSEKEIQELEHHMAECGECEQTLDNLAIADETLIDALRQPRPNDPLLSEPKLDSVLQRIAAIGVNASIAANGSKSSDFDEVEPDSDLGMIGQAKVDQPSIAYMIDESDTQPKAPAVPNWQPSSVQQLFVDAVLKLKPVEQIAAVTEKLKQVNPSFHISVEHRLALGSDNVTRESKIHHVRIDQRTGGPAWKDLANFIYWPLVALTELKSLDALIAPDTNLSPLTSLPLEELNSVAITTYHSLAEELVRAFPRLKLINGASPKQWLARKQEIEELRKILPALTPQKQLEQVVAKLVESNPGYDGKLSSQYVTASGVEMIKIENMPSLIDLSPIRALPELKQIYCNATRIADLSPLADMPLNLINCGETRVSDLSPLKGMPLNYLNLFLTPVADLSQLKGMPLKVLECP